MPAMVEQIEGVLRRIEEEYPEHPEYRKGVYEIRASLWPAAKSERLPVSVDMSDQVPHFYSHPDFEFYPEELRVVINGTTVMLTLTESKILQELSRHPNRTISKNLLLRQTRLGDDSILVGDEKNINVHIYNIRSKLGLDPERGFYPLETVRSLGFRLVDPTRISNSHSTLEPSI